HGAGPELRFALVGIELSCLEQLERPYDPLPVGGREASRCPRRAFRKDGVKRCWSLALELRGPSLPCPLGRGRPQAELGERRAQVEAGATDHDGALSLR